MPDDDDTGPCSEPIPTEDGGEVVICQMNVGADNMVGGGEWKNVDRGPTPEEAAAEQDRLEERAPIGRSSGDRADQG